jgi:hypothetical protein
MNPKHWARPITTIYHDSVRNWGQRARYVCEYDELGWELSITRNGKTVRLFSWDRETLRDVDFCNSLTHRTTPLIYKIPPLMGLE